MPKIYYGLETYEKIVSFFLKIDEIGVYNQYGTDKSSATYYELSCGFFRDYNCWVPDTNEYDLLRFYPVPINSFLYYAQIYVEKRF